MFKATIVAVAGRRADTLCWTPVVREAVRLKKVAFRVVLAGDSEMATRYQPARKVTAKAVVEVKALWADHGPSAGKQDLAEAGLLWWETSRGSESL